MSQFGPNDFYTSGPSADASYNFDVPEFGQELNFQSFDNTQPSVPPNYDAAYSNAPNSGLGGFYDPTAYTDSSFAQDKSFKQGGAAGGAATGNEFEDEPPLLEELGINPNHIFQKTLAVLNPLRGTDQQILQDTDMAGPLVFCLTLGGILLLSGKVTFSYIYGIGVMGCIFFYCLLSLMVTRSQVTFGAVASVLGYCLLPMVVLSGINILITIHNSDADVNAGSRQLCCCLCCFVFQFRRAKLCRIHLKSSNSSRSSRSSSRSSDNSNNNKGVQSFY